MNTLLEVEDLSVALKTRSGAVTLLDSISFSVQEREVLAIVGESGSGKTSLAMALFCLYAPHTSPLLSGSVRFVGQDVWALPKSALRKMLGKEVSYIFQDPSSALNPIQTIGEQVAELFLLHEGVSEEEARLKAMEALARACFPRVEAAFYTYPHQLSGGMKQRVSIAMATALSPRLIIADEPTTALDVLLQQEIVALLLARVQEEKAALIFISHDIALVSSIADRIAVMYAGEIVEVGPKAQVLHFPAHPYTQALLSCYHLEGKRTPRNVLSDTSNRSRTDGAFRGR